MRTRTIGRDWELTLRMGFVMFLITAIGLAFLAFLWQSGVDVVVLAVFAAIMMGAQYFFSDKLVLLSMGARVVSPQEAPELHAMVERLSLLAGIPKPKVAIADMSVPNAFATGRNPKNAVVCVTTGLMRMLTPDELEAVLAHEIGHIVNRDVMVITLASFIPTLASYLMNLLFWMGLFGGGDRERDRNGASIWLVYLASMLVYWISTLTMLALTRYREYAADRAGAILTGAPNRLASALMKIGGLMAAVPSEDLRQVQHANAFFIVPALKGEDVLEFLSTHPPIPKRIERLRRMQAELEGTL